MKKRPGFAHFLKNDIKIMVQRLRDHASVQGVTSFSEDLTSADWKTKIYFFFS